MSQVHHLVSYANQEAGCGSTSSWGAPLQVTDEELLDDVCAHYCLQR